MLSLCLIFASIGIIAFTLNKMSKSCGPDDFSKQLSGLSIEHCCQVSLKSTETSQSIPYILPGKNSLWIIEICSLKGRVIGSPYQREWTIKENNKTYAIRSPFNKLERNKQFINHALKVKTRVLLIVDDELSFDEYPQWTYSNLNIVHALDIIEQDKQSAYIQSLWRRIKNMNTQKREKIIFPLGHYKIYLILSLIFGLFSLWAS